MDFTKNKTAEVDIVNECLENCSEPLRLQKDYAVNLYGKFNRRLYTTMEKNCLTNNKDSSESDV